MEVWKIIEENENYSVSNFGNVRNDITGKILKNGISRIGYCNLKLTTNGKKSNVMPHRLVAKAFIYNPNNKSCVDHIDNNKLNNNVSNLRWATHSENIMNTTVKTNSKSGTKGVYWYKSSKKWNAQITIDGITKNLGYFDKKEDALQVRLEAVNKLFGLFAHQSEKL